MGEGVGAGATEVARVLAEPVAAEVLRELGAQEGVRVRGDERERAERASRVERAAQRGGGPSP